MKSVTALPAIVLLLVATAHAQQPYSGLEARPIKALSEQQITDLKQGRGMGLALAAELNGYPGPSHILELAGALRLTDAQKQLVDSLFTAMKAEAIPLGEQLIAAEVLMVFNYDVQACVRRLRRLSIEGRARVPQHLAPPCAFPRPGAFEDRRQMQADHRPANPARGADRFVERFARLMT